MKTRPIVLGLGSCLLILCSLFEYKHSVTTKFPNGSSSTSFWFNGAQVATIILYVALFRVGFRMTRLIRQASLRAGVEPSFSYPKGFPFVATMCALVCLIPGYGTDSSGNVVTHFAFGMSDEKWRVWLLILVCYWLTALSRQFSKLSEQIAPKPAIRVD